MFFNLAWVDEYDTLCRRPEEKRRSALGTEGTGDCTAAQSVAICKVGYQVPAFCEGKLWTLEHRMREECRSTGLLAIAAVADGVVKRFAFEREFYSLAKAASVVDLCL